MTEAPTMDAQRAQFMEALADGALQTEGGIMELQAKLTAQEAMEVDRINRDVVMVEFTREFLNQFIDWLNESHIVRDGYLHKFEAHYTSLTQAILETSVRTFNEDA